MEPCFDTIRAENGFVPDPGEERKLVDRDTELVLVNAPHHPTGAVMIDEALEELHDFCAGRGVQFVTDEVYPSDLSWTLHEGCGAAAPCHGTRADSGLSGSSGGMYSVVRGP
jgi:hypothetical protein